MPNIYLLLDEKTSASIKEAAERIQAGSPFLSQLNEHAGLGLVPFHVKAVGSLHMYTHEAIVLTMKRLAAATGPLRGRFVKWECTPSTLRCTVEVESLSEFIEAAHAELPRGRRWTTTHVTIGSCRNIDPVQRDAFLAAVEAAFPITDASIFTCTRVGYQGSDEQTSDGQKSALHALQLSGEEGGRRLGVAAAKARLAARERQLQDELTSFREQRVAAGAGRPDTGKGKGRKHRRLTFAPPSGHTVTATSTYMMDTSQALEPSKLTGGIGKTKLKRASRTHDHHHH